MNVNIEELMLKSSEIGEPTGYFIRIDHEIFAKLIIDKCISLVNTWSDDEPCSEGYDTNAVYAIKKYFGIE